MEPIFTRPSFARRRRTLSFRRLDALGGNELRDTSRGQVCLDVFGGTGSRLARRARGPRLESSNDCSPFVLRTRRSMELSLPAAEVQNFVDEMMHLTVDKLWHGRGAWLTGQ